MILKQSIEKVLETARVEDVIADYVELKQRGINKIGLCPFHDEKTPSFTVSPSKNIYKCFGCGKGGNAVQFLMEHESFSFPESIRYLADKYNIVLEETERTAEHIEEEKTRSSLYIINEYAKNFFREQLMNTEEGRQIGLSYFKQRGYLQTTIDSFELGYLSKNGNSLLEHAKKKGLNQDRMKDLGLLTRNDRDMYRHRIIFPIHNLSGKVLGFGARSLVKDKRSPKYLNSPESDIYNKRKVLYGLYQAKKAIIQEDLCYIVEGYTDVITMHQAGIHHVVSSSGTALTKEQIQLIKRYTNNICLIFDGDQAGFNAAKRALNIVLQQGLNLQILSLPEGDDPDTYIKSNGAQEFKSILANQAEDFIVKLLDWNFSNAENPAQKAEHLKEILESVSFIVDPLKRTYYIQELSKTVGIDERTLIKEVNKIISSRLRKEKKTDSTQSPEPLELSPEKAPAAQVKLDKNDYLDRELCRLLVKYGDKVIEWDEKKTYVSFILLDELAPLLSSIKDKGYRRIIDIAIKNHDESVPVGTGTYTKQSEESVVNLAIDLVHDQYDMSHNWVDKYDYPLQSQEHPDNNIANVIIQILLRYKLRAIQNLIKENKLKFEGVKSESELKRLLQIHQQLEMEKSQVARELNSVVI